MAQSRSRSVSLHVALLRGINVGGKNKLPMKDLAALVEELGGSDVRTYIQSGNVLFGAGAALASRFDRTLSAALEERFELRVPVVLRSADELRSVRRSNPFLVANADPSKLLVMFLRDAPTRAALAKLDPKRSPGDEIRVVGREIFMNLRGGVADTKFTNAYFDATLATVSTGRNWNTLCKLVELCDAG